MIFYVFAYQRYEGKGLIENLFAFNGLRADALGDFFQRNGCELTSPKRDYLCRTRLDWLRWMRWPCPRNSNFLTFFAFCRSVSDLMLMIDWLAIDSKLKFRGHGLRIIALKPHGFLCWLILWVQNHSCFHCSPGVSPKHAKFNHKQILTKMYLEYKLLIEINVCDCNFFFKLTPWFAIYLIY